MIAAPPRPKRRSPNGLWSPQLSFSLFMVVVAGSLVTLIHLIQPRSDGWPGLITVTAFGSATGGAGLVAVLWGARRMATACAAVILLCAVAALLPPIAFMLGSHIGSRPVIGIVLLLMGVGLLITRGHSGRLRLAGLMVVRGSLIATAFVHLAVLVLQDSARLLYVQPAALAFQAALSAGLVLAARLLGRGDRAWLNSLSAPGDASILARLVLPLSLMPMIGGFLNVIAVRLGVTSAAIGYLLDIELSAIALLLIGAWALRAVSQERGDKEALAQTLEASPVIVRALNGAIRYWPRGCESLYGWRAEEVLGASVQTLLRSRYGEPLDDIEACLRREGAWGGEVRQTTCSGQLRWVAVRWVLQPPRTPGAEPLVVETHTDITDLKLTNAELRDSEGYLAHALAAYEIGVVNHDLRTNRTSFSPELERMAGVAPGAFDGDLERFTALFVTDDRVRRESGETPLGNVPRSDQAIRLRRPDGDIRLLRGVQRHVYDDEGRLIRDVGVYMDVTEQQSQTLELEARGARLMEMHAMLAHVSRLSAMGEMAAALAHELNQPLTAIGNAVGAMEMLMDETGSPRSPQAGTKVVRAARHAREQSVRAGEIVRRLREFIARGEADTQAHRLDSLIDDALALAAPNLAAAGVDVRLDLSTAARVVRIDRVQIEQVLVNLFRNAMESMRDQDAPRQIAVSSRRDGDFVEISVKDSGPGVPPEIVERLFSPFQSTKAEGMGVGLSICRRIIEAHGGKMWLASDVGNGADFRFTLPHHDRDLRDVRA